MAELGIDMTYGGALLKVGEELDNVETLEEDAKWVQQVLHDRPEFSRVLSNPTVHREDKRKMVKTVFKEHVSQEFLNFLCVLTDKGKFRHYDRIIKAFEKLKDLTYGTVYSVHPLSESQMDRLQAQSEKLLGTKVKLKNEIDETILGGIRILVDGKIVDGTLRKRLDDLGAAMNINASDTAGGNQR